MAAPDPIPRRAPYHDIEGRLRLPIDPRDTPELMPTAGVAAILDAVATGASVERLVALGEAEASVAERLLAIARSPLLGVGREVSGVGEAVALLGAPALRDAALWVTMARIGAQTTPPPFNIDRYCGHAMVRASITFAGAWRAGYESPREAFTASLLQDFGVVVMGLLCPDRAAEIDLCQEHPEGERLLWERALFGGSHAEVFAPFGEAWRLPIGMARALASHHDEVIALPNRRTQRLAELLRLADAVADLCAAGASEQTLARARTKIGALRSRTPMTLAALMAEAVVCAPELARAADVPVPPICTLEEVIGAPTKAPRALRAVRGLGARGILTTAEPTLRVEQLRREKEHLARELRVNRARVSQLSQVDAVTGASSRRELARLLVKMIADPARTGPLSVVLVELEDAVAEAGGGAAGDALLREAAVRMRATLRVEDVIGRIGSDTPAFGLLLPGCAAADGPAVAARLVERLRFAPTGSGAEVPITVQLGGTTVPVGVEPAIEDLVAACEQAVEDGRRDGATVRWCALESGDPDG